MHTAFFISFMWRDGVCVYVYVLGVLGIDLASFICGRLSPPSLR